MHPARRVEAGQSGDEKDGLTTSFAGTSPEVFLQNVVRSDMECIRVGGGGGGGGRLRTEGGGGD